jgi:hypothetical protein
MPSYWHLRGTLRTQKSFFFQVDKQLKSSQACILIEQGWIYWASIITQLRPQRGDEKILAEPGASFSQSRTKSCSRRNINNNIASSTKRGIKWLWWNSNRWWVLAQTLLSIFNNVCEGAIRGYSKDAANNWCEKTMTTIFSTARQLILLDVLQKGSKFNQEYFIDYLFSDLKTENRNFRHRMPLATLWVHMDNSMCYNGSKIVSKFHKHHITRWPHSPYSRGLGPLDFWLSGMLKWMLKDREFHAHDEIEETIPMTWNDLTFDEIQNAFHN